MGFPATIIRIYIKKEEVESILKDKDWNSVESFKVSDETLKDLDKTSLDLSTIRVYRGYKDDGTEAELNEINMTIPNKKNDPLTNDIKGCYIKNTKNSWFFNNFEMLVPNYKNVLRNDYVHLKIYTLRKSSIMLGIITFISFLLLI